MFRKILMLLILAFMLATFAPALAQNPPPPVRITSATGNPNSCRLGTPIASITATFDIAGDITLVTQAFSLVNKTEVIRPTAGGGDSINLVVDAPDLPDNTLIAFTVHNGDPVYKAGVTVNCTTGEVFGGGVLGPDGRFDMGDDMPIVLFPRLDRNNKPYLEVWTVVGSEGNRSLVRRTDRIDNDTISTMPDDGQPNVALQTIGNGLATLYRLSDGTYQLNFVPDFEGKVKVVMFNGVPPTRIVREDFEPPRS
jgi:hypothetical protein